MILNPSTFNPDPVNEDVNGIFCALNLSPKPKTTTLDLQTPNEDIRGTLTIPAENFSQNPSPSTLTLTPSLDPTLNLNICFTLMA
jgi:hypothetical protein